MGAADFLGVDVPCVPFVPFDVPFVSASASLYEWSADLSFSGSMSSSLDAYLGLFVIALALLLRLRGWSSDCGGTGDDWAAGRCEGDGKCDGESGKSKGDGDRGHSEGGLVGDPCNERVDGDLGGAGGVTTSWFGSFCALGGVEEDVSTGLVFVM